ARGRRCRGSRGSGVLRGRPPRTGSPRTSILRHRRRGCRFRVPSMQPSITLSFRGETFGRRPTVESPESIITTGSMDSGPAPYGASQNDVHLLGSRIAQLLRPSPSLELRRSLLEKRRHTLAKILRRARRLLALDFEVD